LERVLFESTQTAVVKPTVSAPNTPTTDKKENLEDSNFEDDGKDQIRKRRLLRFSQQ